METLTWNPDTLWAKETQRIYQALLKMLDITPQALAEGEKTIPLERSQKQLVFACAELLAMLLYKNKNYGDSALTPMGILTKNMPASAGIRVRIEDKLRRMMNGDGSDDLLLDIPGYFVLLRIAEHNEWVRKIHINETDLKKAIGEEAATRAREAALQSIVALEQRAAAMPEYCEVSAKLSKSAI